MMREVCNPTMVPTNPQEPQGWPAHAYLWVIAKLVVKALPGPLIRVGNGDILGIRQRLEARPQEWDAALKQRQHGITKVKALLEGVDVKDHDTGGAATG